MEDISSKRIRVTKTTTQKKKQISLVRRTESEIHELLKAAGYMKDQEKISKCCLSALTKGYICFEGKSEELNSPVRLAKRGGAILSVVFSDICSHDLIPTLKMLLDQPDYAGTDYEDGMESATVKCTEKNCEGRTYITGMCYGDFQPDCGKSHNHCRECNGLGECIYDYRNSHCHYCGNHYFAGLMGFFPCDSCNRSYDGTYDNPDESDEDDHDSSED